MNEVEVYYVGIKNKRDIFFYLFTKLYSLYISFLITFLTHKDKLKLHFISIHALKLYIYYTI